MNDLVDLFSKRRQKYMQEIAKYARLILNDHFAFILMLVIVVGAIYYRTLLEQLSLTSYDVTFMIQLGLLVVYIGISMIGRPIWLMTSADASYIFPLGPQFKRYWFLGTVAGSGLSTLMLSLGYFMSIPLWGFFSTYTQPALIVTGVLLIIIHLIGRLDDYWMIFGLVSNQWWSRLYRTIGFGSLIFWPTQFGQLFSAGWILIGLVRCWFLFNKESQSSIDFNYVVEMDERRQAHFYRFIAFFADVPQIQTTIQRRKYLDPGMQWLSRLSDNQYYHLYLRIIWRNQSFSNLIVRLVFVTSLLLLFTQNVILKLALIMMSLLLITMQLLPVTLKYQTLNRPDLLKPRLRGLQLAVGVTHLVGSIILVLIAMIDVKSLMNIFIIIGGTFVWLVMLMFVYIPWWYRQKGKGGL